jgi:hypothetical protein
LTLQLIRITVTASGIVSSQRAANSRTTATAAAFDLGGGENVHMPENEQFVNVGSFRVSLDSKVRVADLQLLKEIAFRTGGLPGLKVLVDILTEMQEAALPSAAVANE